MLTAWRETPRRSPSCSWERWARFRAWVMRSFSSIVLSPFRSICVFNIANGENLDKKKKLELCQPKVDKGRKSRFSYKMDRMRMAQMTPRITAPTVAPKVMPCFSSVSLLEEAIGAMEGCSMSWERGVSPVASW